MTSKISALYSFMQSNRTYNFQFQKAVLTSWIQPFKTGSEKAYSVLLNVYQTQSRPSLDRAKDFFQSIFYSNKSLTSFNLFSEFLGASHACNFHQLFIAVNNVPGWGKKTASLLMKILYQLNSYKQLDNLLFWQDTPKLKSSDILFLPVDQVILEIFKHINEKKNSFERINSLLIKNYTPSELEVWDDLWFWGYFNQKGSGSNRTLEFNYGKYWITVIPIKILR
jgi:hypothetical protein